MLNRDYLDKELSQLPIGSQSDVLEKLVSLNNSYYVRKPLKITKNFCWGPNSYTNVKRTINDIEWGYSQKRTMTHLVSSNSCNYYNVAQFKDRLKDIDKTLQNLRYRGAIWTDDNDEEYLNILNSLKDKFVNELSDVKKFYDMDVECVGDDNINNLVHEIFSKYEPTNKLYFIEGIGNIYLLFDILCNIEVFNGEDKTPIDSIPYGKILCIVRYKNKFALAKSLSTRCHPDIDVLPRPYSKNIIHPFISRSHYYKPENKYPLYALCQGSTYCTGSITIEPHFGSFNLVKGIHQFKTWLNTYRLGITGPLNSFRESFYGIRTNYNEYNDVLEDAVPFNCTNRVKDKKYCIECNSTYKKMISDYPDMTFKCENLNDINIEDLTTEEIQKKMVRWASSQQQR